MVAIAEHRIVTPLCYGAPHRRTPTSRGHDGGARLGVSPTRESDMAKIGKADRNKVVGPMVRVRMGREEREAKGIELAEETESLAELKNDAREVAVSHRKKIKAQQKVVTKLADEVRTGEREEPAQADMGFQDPPPPSDEDAPDGDADGGKPKGKKGRK